MSTLAEVGLGQAMMTDQCLEEVFEGQLASGAIGAVGRYKVVLLNLALGALALTQAGTKFWSHLSDAETNTKSDGATVGPLGYTKGSGITLTGANLTAIAGHMKGLDFGDISIDNADFRSDAYAIVRDTGNLATSPVLALGKWDVTKTPSGVGAANFKTTVTSPVRFSAAPAA